MGCPQQTRIPFPDAITFTTLPQILQAYISPSCVISSPPPALQALLGSIVLLRETLFAANTSWHTLAHAQALGFLESASQADPMLCETLLQLRSLRWS